MVDIVEPVSARTVFQNLDVDVGSTYADADDAYDTWATALGVTNPGTDLTLTTDWAEGDFYELPFSVLDEGSSGYILFSQTYGIGLYDNDPSVQTGTYTTPYGAFDVGFIPDEYPTLMIGAVTTEAARNCRSTAPPTSRRTSRSGAASWSLAARPPRRCWPR